MSYSSLDTILGETALQNWSNFNTYTYLLLHQDANVAELAQKFPMFLEKLVRQISGDDASFDEEAQTLILRPLTDIYLNPRNEEEEIGVVGDITTVYAFAVIALLILVVACVNFVNLSTARSASRAKEIGLRKVMGAGKASLIGQFLGEAVIFSTLALGIACVLVELSLPAFNAFTIKQVTFWSANIPLLLPGLALLAVVVGIAAGAYPAFFLSRFRPVQVLKDTQRTGSGGMSLWLRKGLVVLQFAISIMLIIGTLIIDRQMAYLKNKHLGFQKDQILVFSQRDPALLPEIQAVKAELLQQANVLGVGAADGILGQQNYSSTAIRKEGGREDELVLVYRLAVDDQFLPTLDISLAAGRNFSAELASDRESACIINEAAMARLGWSSPDMAIGKLLTTGGGDREEKATIIGVVKDFHFTSLHRKVEPLILDTRNDGLRAYSYYIKLRAHDVSETLVALKQTFKALAPNSPFQYVFLDERFEALYRREERMQQILGYCAFLAIFIACLGLFGLASFMTAQRTKEIGIRKTLGASVTGITILLCKQFVQWVLFANLIAWPIAYFAMSRWLQSFAYRTEIYLWVFVAAACSTLLIALLTVSWQSVKAALANPIKALRYE